MSFTIKVNQGNRHVEILDDGLIYTRLRYNEYTEQHVQEIAEKVVVCLQQQEDLDDKIGYLETAKKRIQNLEIRFLTLARGLMKDHGGQPIAADTCGTCRNLWLKHVDPDLTCPVG